MKLVIYDDQVRKLQDSCLDWLQLVRDCKSGRWISLLGTSGCGKTHCAKWLFNAASCIVKCQSEFSPSVVHWPSLIDDLRSKERYNEVRDMRNWTVLVLDDIFAEKDTTGFSADKLNTLLGCRSRKWTILTSNLSWSAISKAEARIADRMIRDDGIVVEMNCMSYARWKMTQGSKVNEP